MKVRRHVTDHLAAVVLYATLDESAFDARHEHAIGADALIQFVPQHRVAGNPRGLEVVEPQIVNLAGGGAIRERL